MYLNHLHNKDERKRVNIDGERSKRKSKQPSHNLPFRYLLKEEKYNTENKTKTKEGPYKCPDSIYLTYYAFNFLPSQQEQKQISFYEYRHVILILFLILYTILPSTTLPTLTK